MKKLYSLLIIIVMLFLQSYMLFADNNIIEETELYFEFIGRDEGLSNLAVSTIIQDKYGFLWFGTQGGLNRYDGREIEVIRNNPFEEDGLVHNLIQTMYYDYEKHELWIGTYHGVSQYIISENRFVNYTVENNNLSNPVVVAIAKDLNGNMWFGTMNGLSKLETETDSLVNFEVPGDVVRSLLIDSKDRMLIGTYEGLHYFDSDNETIESISLDLPSPYVMVIEEFDKGVISLGLWDGGVVEVDIETNDINVRNYDDNRVYSLIKTDNDMLWVGTWGGGLFTEDINGKVTQFVSEGSTDTLVHNVVYSMHQDHSGIVWIGTNGGGINKINPRKSNFVELSFDPETNNSLSQGKINKVFEDNHGMLWMAVYNNGLNMYDPTNHIIDKYSNDPDDENTLPNNQVNEIYEFGDDMLFGTNSGIAKLDREDNKFSLIESLPEDTLVYAIEKINETELWLGTYLNGLFIYNIENDTYENFKSDDDLNPVADNLIYDIYADTKGRVWIATNNGLNMKEPNIDKFKLYQKEIGNTSSLASNTVRSIYEDSKGRIWIGMVGGGVAYFTEENESFISFTEIDGLSSNIVTGIVEDDKDRIWVATHNGISIIQPEYREVFYLTPDDGIGGWEFSSNAIKTNDGSLMFGGVHGITRIPSSYISVEMPEPRVYITDVYLFQEPVDENRLFFNNADLDFGPTDSYLEFRVVALDYDTPSETRFSYKLEGFDDEWINAGTRDYISYSNLPAGEYELKVICETARNVVTEPVSLSFSIATAWYNSIIAYIGYFILLVIVVIGLVKLREGRLLAIRNSELGIINYKLEEANTELGQLSTKDSLTNLFNRRYFDMMFADHLKLSIRGNAYISLIMIDIDDFKIVNDKFGHVAGDYLLIDVAETVRRVVSRATDFVARYGGDELVVVLYDTNIEVTMSIANKIAEELRKVKVRDKYSNDEYFITTSIGIACEEPKFDSTIEEYIDAADRALYESKKNGKNCININKTL